MKETLRMEMEMEQKMCSNCKKSSAEYFELLTQLRLEYFDDIPSMKNEIMESLLSNFNSINKIEEVSNGIDVYFRNHSEMNKTISLFQKKYICEEKRSKKLVGRDNLASKDKYRYFQSITLINIKKGDKLAIKGKEYTVKAVNNNSILILIDERGTKTNETYSIIKDYVQIIEKKD